MHLLEGMNMNIKDIKKISVIGAGMMGHGIAQIFATQNYDVTLLDVRQDLLSKAIENVRSNLILLAQKGIGDPKEIEPTIRRIKTTLDLKEAASEAQLIIEAASENLTLKQKIFQELDSLCPSETILATNTSVIRITEIAQRARIKERILGTHFWFPPYLIPLVEVVKGKDTSDETMELTYQFLKKAGKYPIKCLKDVPGFVANRLQHALWREAISIVEKGIADAATVDDAIKNSFGIRLAVLGPIENADMAGLDLILAIHDTVLKDLEASPNPSPLLKEKVKKGELGFKSGKGFYDHWTQEDIKRVRGNLLTYLIDYSNKKSG
jgi:3-hydroxybutyryl-CoA dehydrogenase